MTEAERALLIAVAKAVYALTGLGGNSSAARAAQRHLDEALERISREALAVSQ